MTERANDVDTKSTDLAFGSFDCSEFHESLASVGSAAELGTVVDGPGNVPPSNTGVDAGEPPSPRPKRDGSRLDRLALSRLADDGGPLNEGIDELPWP